MTVLIILQLPVVFLDYGIQHCLLAFHLCQGLVIPIAFCITLHARSAVDAAAHRGSYRITLMFFKPGYLLERGVGPKID